MLLLLLLLLLLLFIFSYSFFLTGWWLETYPKNEDIHQDLKCEIFTRPEAFIFKASYWEWYDSTIPCRSKIPRISLEQID